MSDFETAPLQHTLTVVQCDHVEGIEQLPLVLMDAFHLAVEHGLWVHLNTIGGLKVLCKLVFVVLCVRACVCVHARMRACMQGEVRGEG